MTVITDDDFLHIYYDLFQWFNNAYEEVYVIETSDNLDDYKKYFRSEHRDVFKGRLPYWLTSDKDMYEFYQTTNGQGQLEEISLYCLSTNTVITKPQIWFMFYKGLTKSDFRLIQTGNQRRKNFISVKENK